MKTSWKIGAIVGLVAIMSMAAIGVAYADSGSATSNCQCQSLCLFSSVTPVNNNPLVSIIATITNNGETINVTITNDYPGYDASVAFIITNNNSTPGLVDSITPTIPANVSKYFSLTLPDVLNQEIGPNGGTLHGTLDIDFNSIAPNSSMGQSYSMSVTILVTQYAQPCPTKTSTCLTSTLNPSAYGQGVTFTANVSPNTATGNVTFYDGTAVLSSNISLISGSASINVSNLTVGSHNITASYNGNSSFASSTSNVVVQIVRCKTIITWPIGPCWPSKPKPCTCGQPCTFTAQVGVQSPGTGIPTGTVTFYNGSNNIGSSTLGNTGTAVLSCNSLPAGFNSITAVYNGDDNNDPSTSGPITQSVSPANSTTTVSAATNPSVFGQSVAFTATVCPNTATGTVTFKDGNNTLGTAALSGGSATLSVSNLAVGSHSISAIYGGDINDTGSTSCAITEIVVAKPVITSLSLPNGTKNCSYSQTLSVSGGLAPFTWSIIGSLSVGLSLNTSTGVISGKPTSSGTYTFTTKVADSLGNIATQNFSIKIN